MESLKINKINKPVSGNIQITGSKSETNRLLILQQFYKNLQIENISNSDDSVLMQKALLSTSNEINIGHAGTAMRFLTSYFAVKENSEIILTGSHRMKDRPIKILVDALKSLGANIQYLEKEGFPPLKIIGKKLLHNFVEIDGNVSSQYISALLLIASKLDNGLELTLNGKITSVPYIKMTLSLLNEIGVETSFIENIISVKPNNSKLLPQTLTVESDWSSASYFYSVIALSDIGTEITIASYKKESLQGDSVLVKIYQSFGVTTHYNSNSIRLVKTEETQTSNLEFHLSDAPDIAQTIAVTAFGLGVECYLTGLHTLKIKETDRLIALENELSKLGAQIRVTEESLHLSAAQDFKANQTIATYSDHRMAMAFAPLALRLPYLEIEEEQVVDKSYPEFWEHLSAVGGMVV